MSEIAVTSGNKIKKYVDVIYLIVLFLYMAETACSMVFVTPFFCGYYSHMAPFLFLAIAIYKLVIEYGINKKKAIIAALFVLSSIGLSFLIKDDLAFATVAFAMAGALGVNADRVIGCGIAGNIVMVISNIITSFIVDPSSLNTQIQERNFFYLKDSLFVPKINNRSSTDLAAHYFWMIAAYMWIRGKKITWGEIFALAALNAVVYSLTGSSNLLLCCGILLAFAIIVKLFHKITEAENNSFVNAIRKILSALSKFSYLIFAAASIILSAVFNLSNPLLNNLNNVFHSRFSYGHRGMVEYGIHLFASDVPNYGIDTSADGFYNFIDNSYVNILVGSGIILLLFYVCFMTVIQMRHKKYVYGAVILAVCALSCVEEHHFAEIAYNFFPLLLFADINDEEKNSSVFKFLKPKVVAFSSFSAFALLCVAAASINLQWFGKIDALDKLDRRSGEICASVQKSLDNGSSDTISQMSSDQYGDVLVCPEDFESVTGISWNDASDNLKAHSYYAFYYDNTVDPSSSGMTDILISDETKQLIGNGSAVIEYDAVAGKVYSVWYSETKGCSVFNDGRINRAVRLRMDKHPEGYYTGEVYG